jgi:hypothetical protein
MERQERDVVWLVLDASVDGWAGAPGSAPLDRAVDEVAAAAARHLAKGDKVGLTILASRTRTWIVPAGGRAQAALISTALSGCSSMVDADRCELDEVEIAQRVAEHLKPLARDSALTYPPTDLDDLARVAESVRGRAPFEARVPHAATPRERVLRHYLACFGIEVPPRVEGERPRAESELARTVSKLARVKPRPSVVLVWAPPPAPHGLVSRGVRALRARRILVRWTLADVEPSLQGGAADDRRSPVAASMQAAVLLRVRAEQSRAAGWLRALGVKPGTRVARPSLAEPVRLVSTDDPVESVEP